MTAGVVFIKKLRLNFQIVINFKFCDTTCNYPGVLASKLLKDLQLKT